MTSNPHDDLSGDIRDFRRALYRALSHMLNDLKKETDKLERELEDGPEKPAEVIGYLGGIPIMDKSPRRSRIRGPNIYLSAQKAAEQFPERKALVKSFLKNAAEDVGYVQAFFLLRSTFQYAVIRKEIVDLSCDYDVLKPYTGKLPSSDEIAEFLVASYVYEKTLTRDILINLANRYSVLPLLDVVCDNPFLRGNKTDWNLAKKAISDAIVGLGGDQLAFRKDMSAIMIALDYNVFRDLERYISTAKEVNGAFSLIVFPLDEDKIEMLQFGALKFSGYLYNKDEYSKALTGALDEAGEKGCFTQNELSVISDNANKRTSEDIELYIDPKDEYVAEYFLGLKKNLKNMVKIRKIAQILTEVGCIKSKQTPLLVYRLSGNCRPEKLNTISWIPQISRAKRHKSTPEEYRHPYELYYLLYHMYEENPVKYAEKVFRFFDFDDLTMKVRSAFYPAPKIAQLARTTDRGFKERLHTVDGSVFPLPE